MRIDGLSGTAAQALQPGLSQTTDSVSRNLQQQITAAEKKLQDLSSNEELSMEEKMKKRQEIQREISDLNNQLRQHQMELKREAQREKEEATNNTEKQETNNGAAKDSNQTGLSQLSMKSIISADNAMDQASVQGSVANKMKNKANILKAEMKQDAARGGNSQMKEEELAKTERASVNATTSQMNTLSNANKEATSTLSATNNNDSTDEKDGKYENNENNENNEKDEITYKPIDIRL